MRTGAMIQPTFWTRGSGKKLRGDANAQVLAFYFMTGPASNWTGLYYLPRVTLLHDTGLTEEELAKALPKVAEIARYDEQEQIVYLPEGAARQIGETLTLNDKKRKSVLNQVRTYGNHPFVVEWVSRYYDAYHLANEGLARPQEAPSKPHPSPFDGASGKQDAPFPDLDQDLDHSEKRGVGVVNPKKEVPLVADLVTRAKTWVRDVMRATLAYPSPEQWAETLELRDLVATTFAIEPDTLSGPDRHGRPDPRVWALLERWAEGIPQARMRLAVRGAGADPFLRGKPQLQSLATIFKDGNAVDKYARLARAASGGDPGAAPSRTNRVTLTPEAAERRKKFLAGNHE